MRANPTLLHPVESALKNRRKVEDRRRTQQPVSAGADLPAKHER
jgi:hypothetical protein